MQNQPTEGKVPHLMDDFVSLDSVKVGKRKTNIHKQKVNWHNIVWISKEKH